MTNQQVKCKSCHGVLDLSNGRGVVRCEYCGTDNVLSKDVRVAVAEYSHGFKVAFYKAVAHEFSLDELQDLVVRLSGEVPSVHYLDYENIAGNTRTMKALNLIDWFYRRMLLQELLDVVIALRPTIVINV